jgi:hypothetical protein
MEDVNESDEKVAEAEVLHTAVLAASSLSLLA